MKTRLYLDTRNKKGSEFPVKIAINSKGSSAYIGTGVSVHPDNWDSKACCIVKHPAGARLNLALSEKKLAVDKTLESLRADGALHGLRVSEIKGLVERALRGGGTGISDDGEVGVLECLRSIARGKDKARTAQGFYETEKRIHAYADDADGLRFTDITPSWLMGFDAFLAKTNRSANSRAVYLRSIRTAFNWAIGEGLTDARYPFRRFKIRKSPTKDRSLTREELRAIAEVRCSPSQAKYRDIFLLSFLLCGANIADLMGLTDVRGGRIEYRRAKTGQPVSVGVGREAARIIDRYRGEHFLLDLAETHSRPKNYLRRLNENLKRLGTEYNPHTKKWEGEAIVGDISYYCARYSWATIAAELDVPERTIGAALGHSTSKSVTSIYTRVDMRKKVDDANRKVIDFVFGNGVL